MQLCLGGDLLDQLDICAFALFLQSERVALLVRVQLDHLYCGVHLLLMGVNDFVIGLVSMVKGLVDIWIACNNG